MYLDSNQFEEIYNKWYKQIYHFVFFKIRDGEQSKDIASEVFLSAMRSWKEIPDEDSECKKRLFIIAKSRIIDYFRSAHYNRSMPGTSLGNDEESFFDNQISNDPLPEDLFIESETRNLVTELLNTVSGEDRDLLIARFLQDMSYKEISEIYGVNEQALRKRVERSLKKIQNQIDDKLIKKVENILQ